MGRGEVGGVVKTESEGADIMPGAGSGVALLVREELGVAINGDERVSATSRDEEGGVRWRDDSSTGFDLVNCQTKNLQNERSTHPDGEGVSIAAIGKGEKRLIPLLCLSI